MTILFADIVNFTQLASKMDAAELVENLNHLYARFDDAAKVNEKLTEIGKKKMIAVVNDFCIFLEKRLSPCEITRRLLLLCFWDTQDN